MVATMRENDSAPVVELEFSKTHTVSRASYIMKPSPIKEKPPAWRFYTSDCIALDRLVEVALSPTGILDSSFRNNAKTPESQVPSKFYPKSAGSRDSSRDGEGEDDGDSAEKRRYCCSNGIKLTKPAAPSPSSPSPSSEAPNHQSAGYFQQQRQQQQQQKLKRRLSSFNEISREISTPAGRSSSSLRVHVEHPHAKRFKLTPRFKALVDISC